MKRNGLGIGDADGSFYYGTDTLRPFAPAVLQNVRGASDDRARLVMDPSYRNAQYVFSLDVERRMLRNTISAFIERVTKR